jgi:hypothetical protein
VAPPQFAPGLRKVALHITAQNGNAAAGGSGQTRQNADHRGFAGPIGAQQAEKLALFNIKLHAIQGLERATLRRARRWIGFGDGLKGDGGHEEPPF